MTLRQQPARGEIQWLISLTFQNYIATLEKAQKKIAKAIEKRASAKLKKLEGQMHKLVRSMAYERVAINARLT
jgi:hypothetical protein